VFRLPEENVDNNLAFLQLMFITQHASAVAVLLVDSYNLSAHLLGTGHD
jgi:hypothetical protein